MSEEEIKVGPPTERFPDGVKELVRDSSKSPLRMKFIARAEQHKQAKQALRQAHISRVENKRQKMIKGGVPAEKRNV